MRTRVAPGWVIGSALLLVLLLALTAGCAAPTRPNDPSPSPIPVASVPIPADGLPLAAYGLSHGPVRQLSLPRGSMLAVTVDQTNNVAVVLSSPPAAELFGYLRRTLPEAGFELTAVDAATSTLTFTGYGWTGRFTGDSQASALLLRPG